MVFFLCIRRFNLSCLLLLFELVVGVSDMVISITALSV
jgi:hypothetical protein